MDPLEDYGILLPLINCSIEAYGPLRFSLTLDLRLKFRSQADHVHGKDVIHTLLIEILGVLSGPDV
jgi:hypothetical protein